MNTYHHSVTVNGVEVIDSNDMIEFPLDLAICYRRDAEDGRMENDAEISNLDVGEQVAMLLTRRRELK